MRGAQGARIVFYRAKIIGENDDTLFDYVLDTEMGSGGWTIDDKLQNPSGDGLPPAPEFTETPAETRTP
jgi:hypothetical protein